jgi:hypothetical protein
MLKIILAGLVPLSAFVGFSSDAAAQRVRANQETVCKEAFARNKATIERLAAAGNESGIRAIFARAGCSGVVANVEKRPASPAARIRIRCTFSYPPATVTCTVTL